MVAIDGCWMSLIHKDSKLIIVESIWSPELSNYSTISQDLLLNLRFRHCILDLRGFDEIRLINFGSRCAGLKVSTGLPFCCSFVRSTLLRDKVSILCKVAVEHRPSAFTSLVQVITRQNLLGR